MRTLPIAIAGLAALIAAPGASAEEIRYSTFAPPGSSTYNEIVRFFDDLKEQSGGELTSRIFPASQLLSARDTLKGVGDGVVESGYVIPAFQLGALRSFQIPSDLFFYQRDPMPYMAAVLETQIVGCKDCKDLEKNANVSWLGGFSPSPVYLMCAGKIASAADMKGLKVRVAGSGQSRLIGALGAVSISMPPPEIAPSLESGQINCAVGPVSWLRDYGLIDSIDTIVDYPLGIAGGLGMYVFNRNFIAGLSADKRKALLDTLAVSVVRGTQSYADETAEIRAKGEANGITFWKPDQAFQEVYESFSKSDFPNVAKDLKERGVPDPEDLIKTFTDASDKWSAKWSELNGDQDKLAAAIRADIYSNAILP